ncbi:atp18 subunit J of the mitochondrial F1F0 ATP synthase [Kluyveromyces marxianus]|nr:atp18 subunit J of the mitochondrial F1F0 ATP synthase [Kluyveromyces marxianus]
MVKRFPTPVLKPYWPFFAGGAIMLYAISKAADLSANSKEFINDPRNPRFARGEKPLKEEQTGRQTFQW